MVGIIVQLFLSWLIIWLYEKGNLSFMGLKPTKKRLLLFFLFFSITIACAVSGFFLRMLIAKQSWTLNPEMSFNHILNGFWFVIKSVLFEEFIFRGVLLYILIRKLGSTKAIIISAITFGIYHWFSHELWGNPQQMAIEFFITGAMGLVLAYGYAKTYSLYVPIAIHLGWNLVQMVIFSNGNSGQQIFIQQVQATEVVLSYLSYFVITLFPLLSCLLINALILKKIRSENFINNNFRNSDR